MRINLPIGTYKDRSASTRRLVNCTAQQAPVDARGPIILKRMPGIDSWAEAGSEVRGRHVFNNVLYVVSSQTLYSISSAGVATSIGTIPGTNRVKMADNGTTMVIVVGPAAYYTTGSSVTQITDSTFTGWGAYDVDFIDGYFVFTNEDIMFNSGLNALTFNALDFTTPDGAPDKIKGHIVDHREIFIAKQRSCELWYNAANATGSPLSRSPGGFFEVGCASADTIAKIDGSIFWLADDFTVRRLTGNIPQVISTDGISEVIRATDKTNSYGFAYTFENGFYYVLSFPDITLEYDIRANEWHERESYGYVNWRPMGTIEAYNEVIVCDAYSGKVGKLNRDTYTEWGDTHVIKWTYQPLYRGGRRFFLDRFEINMKTGVGLTTGQGSDPRIMLHISYDGETYSEMPNTSMGPIGDYQYRVKWHQLGSGYNIVLRAEVSDPVDVVAFDSNAEIRDARY